MHRDQLPIAEPCNADWGAMSGTACKRFCGDCQLHVHDLSAMTERRAKHLLASGGRICVRYTTGADGRILHRKAPWARAIAVAAALFSATPAVASPAPAPAADDDAPTVIERLTKAVLDWVAPAEEEEVVISTGQVQVKMGEVAPEPEPEPKPQVRMGRVAPGR